VIPLQASIQKRRPLRLLVAGIAMLAAVTTLAILYGIFPGLRPSAGMQQFFLGLAACYAEHLPESIRCDAVAQPGGYTTMFGLPVVLMISALYRLGLALDMAGMAVEAVMVAVAALGAHRLFTALGMRTRLSMLMVFVFLSSPIVFAQDSFGPLRLGFALVPLYGWLDYHFAKRIRRVDRRGELLRLALAGLLVLSISRSFALYTDGYSFIMGLLLSAALVGSQWLPVARAGRTVRATLLPLVFALPTLVAYIAYRSYVGGAVESTVMPIDYFRGQGVDLFALAVPSMMHWLPGALGWSHQLTGWMTYSDGPNVTLVYLGWSLIIPALVLTAKVIRGRGPESVRGEAMLLVAMTVAVLILSLGPSLKVADFREQPRPERGIVFDDYRMPESAATLSLGTDWVYQHVPGVRNMRAVYRWLLLAKLGLVILAGLFLECMLRRNGRRPVAYLVVALLLLELMPDIVARFTYGERNYRQYHALVEDALGSLKATGLTGRRVVFVNSDPDGGANHYLANFLCPLADLRCFNLGGDKSLQVARLEWPHALRELSRGRHVVSNLRELLLDRSVDHVVMPLFSLRQAAYYWPPSAADVRQRLEYARKVADGIPARIERQAWFVVLRADAAQLRDMRSERAPEAGKVVEIDGWGPSAAEPEDGFNVQSDGRSSFWVRVMAISEPMGRFALVLDGEEMETFHRGRIISARFWKESDLRALETGEYPLQILDRESNRIQDLGMFKIVSRRPAGQ